MTEQFAIDLEQLVGMLFPTLREVERGSFIWLQDKFDLLSPYHRLGQGFTAGGDIGNAGTMREHPAKARQIRRDDQAFIGESHAGTFQRTSSMDIHVWEDLDITGSHILWQVVWLKNRRVEMDARIAHGQFEQALAEFTLGRMAHQQKAGIGQALTAPATVEEQVKSLQQKGQFTLGMQVSQAEIYKSSG